MEAQKNKHDDGSWCEVSTLTGVPLDSTLFDYSGGFDSDEEDDLLVPVTLKLRLTNDDPTPSTSDGNIVLAMDFETLSETDDDDDPNGRWSMVDELDAPLVSSEDSTKSFFLSGQAESISGDWMDTSMTAADWERLREEETADAASLRQLYWDSRRAHDEQMHETCPERWAMSKWTSTTWDYNESP